MCACGRKRWGSCSFFIVQPRTVEAKPGALQGLFKVKGRNVWKARTWSEWGSEETKSKPKAVMSSPSKYAQTEASLSYELREASRRRSEVEAWWEGRTGSGGGGGGGGVGGVQWSRQLRGCAATRRWDAEHAGLRRGPGARLRSAWVPGRHCQWGCSWGHPDPPAYFTLQKSWIWFNSGSRGIAGYSWTLPRSFISFLSPDKYFLRNNSLCGS